MRFLSTLLKDSELLPPYRSVLSLHLDFLYFPVTMLRTRGSHIVSESLPPPTRAYPSNANRSIELRFWHLRIRRLRGYGSLSADLPLSCLKLYYRRRRLIS